MGRRRGGGEELRGREVERGLGWVGGWGSGERERERDGERERTR